MNLASELERLNCCQNSWYICLSLWNYTAKAQAQDLHFQHVHSQQTRGWGGGEGVLLGAESRGQTPGGSKFKKKKNTFECSRYCPGVVWLQVFQSLSLCFFKLELASVLGSDYAARCVFTAFLIPPHNCWHTHTLRISFEIRNWNHWPLHTMSWLASLPDINSSSTHCVIWGHMKEKEVFFFFFFFFFVC